MKKSSRLISAVLLGVTLSTLSCSAFAASDNTSDVDRKIKTLSGATRYQTAVAVSQKWDSSDTVVLVNGQQIVDALSAAPYAKLKDAPILLTEANHLNGSTRTEIKRLKAKKVVIIGGTGVVSNQVVKELKDMGISSVERIGGSNRNETSFNVAKKLGNTEEVVVVNGVRGLADALSIAAPAAREGMPILLTDSNGYNLGPSNDLVRNAKKVYIIGGDGVVSTKLGDSIKNSERIAGINRTETNGAVLQKFYNNGSYNNIYVAKDGSKNESYLVDALSAAPLAAKENDPVLLAGEILSVKQQNYLDNITTANITTVGDGVDKLTVFDIYRELLVNDVVSGITPLFPNRNDATAPSLVNVKYGGSKDNKIYIEFSDVMKVSGDGSILNKNLYQVNINGDGFKSLADIKDVGMDYSLDHKKLTITFNDTNVNEVESNKGRTLSSVEIKIGKVANLKGKYLDTSIRDKVIDVKYEGDVQEAPGCKPEIVDRRILNIYVTGNYNLLKPVDVTKIKVTTKGDAPSNSGIIENIFGFNKGPQILMSYLTKTGTDTSRITIVFLNPVFNSDGTNSYIDNITFEKGAFSTKLGTPSEKFTVDMDPTSSGKDENNNSNSSNKPSDTLVVNQIPFVNGTNPQGNEDSSNLSLQNGLMNFDFSSNPALKGYNVTVKNNIPETVKELEAISEKINKDDPSGNIANMPLDPSLIGPVLKVGPKLLNPVKVSVDNNSKEITITLQSPLSTKALNIDTSNPSIASTMKAIQQFKALKGEIDGVMNNPVLNEALKNQQLKALMSNSKTRAMLLDPEVQQLASKKDVQQFINMASSKEVQQLLNDPEVQQLMQMSSTPEGKAQLQKLMADPEVQKLQAMMNEPSMKKLMDDPQVQQLMPLLLKPEVQGILKDKEVQGFLDLAQDPQVQQFLKILNESSIKDVFKNPQSAALMKQALPVLLSGDDTKIEALMGNPQVQELLKANPQLKEFLLQIGNKDSDLGKLVRSPKVQQVIPLLQDKEVQALLNNEQLMGLLQDPEVQTLLKMINDPKTGVAALLQDPEVQALLGNKQLITMLQDPEVQALLANKQLMALLNSEDVQKLLANKNVQAVLQDPQAKALMMSLTPETKALLESGQLQQLMANKELQGLMNKMIDYPDIESALDKALMMNNIKVETPTNMVVNGKVNPAGKIIWVGSIMTESFVSSTGGSSGSNAIAGFEINSIPLENKTLTVNVKVGNGKEDTVTVNIPANTKSQQSASLIRQALNNSNGQWKNTYSIENTNDNRVVFKANTAGLLPQNQQITITTSVK